MGRRRTNGERDRAIFDAYQAGRSACALAAEHRLSHQRVLQIVAAEAERAGVPLRARLAPPPGLRTTLEAAATEAYRAGSKPTGQIASELGMRPDALRRRMRKRGVPRMRLRRRPHASPEGLRPVQGREVAEGSGAGAGRLSNGGQRLHHPRPQGRPQPVLSARKPAASKPGAAGVITGPPQIRSRTVPPVPKTPGATTPAAPSEPPSPSPHPRRGLAAAILPSCAGPLPPPGAPPCGRMEERRGSARPASRRAS